MNAQTLVKCVHDALAIFRLYSNREFFKFDVPSIQKVIESLGNNLPAEVEKGNENNNGQNEHVYKIIVEAEDVVSHEEFEDLKSKTHLDKEYHKLFKHKLSAFLTII